MCVFQYSKAKYQSMFHEKWTSANLINIRNHEKMCLRVSETSQLVEKIKTAFWNQGWLPQLTPSLMYSATDS